MNCACHSVGLDFGYAALHFVQLAEQVLLKLGIA